MDHGTLLTMTTADWRDILTPEDLAQGSPPVARVSRAGDLDLSTTEDLLHDVDDLMEAGYRDVRVDLDAVRFCDVAGLNSLLAAKHRVDRHGGSVTFSGRPCRSLEILLRVYRLGRQLEHVPAGDRR